MKKSLIVLAVLSAVSTGAFACEGGSCTVPGSSFATASVGGSNSVGSGSIASAHANGANSSSLSYAANTTTATTKVGVTADAGYVGANCNTNTNGKVDVNGSVALTSSTIAYNVSTGNGSGLAAAGGVAQGSVSGYGLVDGGNTFSHEVGVASGSASANLASGVFASTNHGATEGAVAGASFDTSVSLGVTTTGTCSQFGCNATGDTKTATSTALATAYSDKVTGVVMNGNTQLANATAGSWVNADAGAAAGGIVNAKVGNKVTVLDTYAPR